MPIGDMREGAGPSREEISRSIDKLIPEAGQVQDEEGALDFLRRFKMLLDQLNTVKSHSKTNVTIPVEDFSLNFGGKAHNFTWIGGGRVDYLKAANGDAEGERLIKAVGGK